MVLMPVYPTPTGNATSPALASDWQNQPTTPATEAQTVAIITQHYGAAKGAEFKAWYDAALLRDPNLTPDNAVGTWLTGTALSGGVGSVAALLGEVPGATAAAADKLPNPLNALTGWTHNIEQWIIRGFEMLLGIGLIVIALAKLASDTPIGSTAIKAGKAAAIL